MSKKNRPRFHQPWLQRDAERIAVWNARYPIGTRVVIETDQHQHLRARTISAAYKPHPHAPVLVDTNQREAVVLARVEPIEKGVAIYAGS